jgi:hypothetical protein
MRYRLDTPLFSQYFEDASGRYVFDPGRLKDAHASCKAVFTAALGRQDGPVVLLDNTHTQLWEYAGYAKDAVSAGAVLRVVEVRVFICL